MKSSLVKIRTLLIVRYYENVPKSSVKLGGLNNVTYIRAQDS